jgi:hypothetical protein
MRIDWGYLENAARRLHGFPSHGWATTEHGFGLLWFPVRGLLWQWSPKMKLLEERGGPDAVASARAFDDTLHKLVLVLRELHELRRALSKIPLLPGEPAESNRQRQLCERATLHLDLTIVYLRRIADRFVGAAKWLIVAHPRGTGDSFTDFRKSVLNEKQSRRPQLLCDADRLANVLRVHCGWFEVLRGTPGRSSPDGLRELMEHRPVFVQVSQSQVGDGPPDLDAYLVNLTDRQQPLTDVLGRLPDITAGLCQFWTEIYSLLDDRTAYDRADCVPVFTGEDADIVGFWPSVQRVGT